MDVHDYVKSVTTVTTHDERVALVRTMYGRYVADLKADNYVPSPIEGFLFFACTCYAWPLGTVVRIRGKADGRAYVVEGYDRRNDTVKLSWNRSAPATELEPADIPETILAVARRQLEAKMAEKCPLKDGAPCLA